MYWSMENDACKYNYTLVTMFLPLTILMKSMFHLIADLSPKFLRTVFWYDEICYLCFVGRVLLESSVLGTNMSLITNSHCEIWSCRILIGGYKSNMTRRRVRRDRSYFNRVIDLVFSFYRFIFFDNFWILYYHRPHKLHNFIGLIQHRCACIFTVWVNSDVYRRSFSDGLHNLDTCACM